MNIHVPILRNAPVCGCGGPVARPIRLTRNFVETGDERCPIAGIWSRLECDPIADDPESTRPAMRRLGPWRAVHLPLTLPRYSLV